MTEQTDSNLLGRAYRTLRAEHSILMLLSSASEFAHAIHPVLKTICETSELDLASIWLTGPGSGKLRFAGMWNKRDLDAAQFEAISRDMSLRRGEELPGRVWSENEPAWVTGLKPDERSAREQAACECNLQSAGGVPIRSEDHVLGVLEVFERRNRQPDRDVLTFLANVSDHLGRFLVRTRAEQALRSSEKRHRELIENSQGLMCTHDLNGVLLSVNHPASAALGYEPEEMIGRSLSDFLHPAFRRDFLAYLASARNSPASTGLINLITRDGTSRVLMFRNSLCAEPGADPYVIGHAVDITALKKAESALAESEERYRTLTETANDVIITVGHDGTILFVNRAAGKVFGYSPDELIGESLGKILPDCLRQSREFPDFGDPQFEPDAWETIEARGMHRGGALLSLEISFGEFNSEVRSFTAIIRDVTERKRADEAIRESEERFRELFENANDVLYTHDLLGSITSVNRAGEKLFGCIRAQIIGTSIYDLVVPEHREMARRMTERQLSGERPTTYEVDVLNTEGRRFTLELNTRLIIQDGMPVGVQGMARDVTERKRAEVEMHRAKLAAEAATQAKSDFLANMSHEIRTPMNAVIGMTGLLLETPLSPEQREYAETIRSSGDALLTVINSILDFSKIESGKLELEQESFDLLACVEDALELFAAAASEKGIELAYTVENDVPKFIVGDVTRLRQILVNLLGNAVKFTERGEVVVSIWAHKIAGRRSRSSTGDAYEIEIAVRDTGIGIPEERMDRLFKSFSQIDSSTTRQYGGTGLGLAISRSLAEMMGGTMWVQSEPGKGSTFSFLICASAGSELDVKERLEDPTLLAGKRVLVVDDNATNRKLVCRHTEAWGMTSREASCGTEALNLLTGGMEFDVAVIDMQMPEMDGVMLAREIRKLDCARNLPMLMLTSLGRREGRLVGQNEFYDILGKPMKPSQLLASLSSVFGKPAKTKVEARTNSTIDPTIADRVPLRILLAEDNVVNQKVALRILQRMGYRADVASNGFEVLDALRRQTYDVVLMDIQMPEMDGYEATRLAVEEWGDGRPRIIAMTANAMKGDRELCLAHGMDDYISKPVRFGELQEALVRSRPRTPHGDNSFESVPVIDTSVLDGLREIGSEGQPDLLSELLTLYLEDSPARLQAIRQAVANFDAKEIERASHSLKGGSANLGAKLLSDVCSQLEECARENRLNEAPRLVEELDAEYSRVRIAFEKLIAATTLNQALRQAC